MADQKAATGPASAELPNPTDLPDIEKPDGYEGNFRPYEHLAFKAEEFDWETWVNDHVLTKDWKGGYEVKPEQMAAHAEAAKKMFDKLVDAEGLNCPPEIAYDLSLLSLYDLVVLLDDSTSMEFRERLPKHVRETLAGDELENKTEKRKVTLSLVLEKVCEIYQCTREEGIISMRYFNHTVGKRDVTSEKGKQEVAGHPCKGVTKIGTELKRKIIDHFVYPVKGSREDPAAFETRKENTVAKKPLLVIVITDGRVEGEKPGLLEHVILKCIEQCAADEEKGATAVSFQFAQVGRDKHAGDFLRKLSMDEFVEQHANIDCVLNASLDYIKDKDLMWEILAQLLLGAITKQWNRHNAPLVWWDYDPAVEEPGDECRRTSARGRDLDDYGVSEASAFMDEPCS